MNKSKKIISLISLISLVSLAGCSKKDPNELNPEANQDLCPDQDSGYYLNFKDESFDYEDGGKNTGEITVNMGDSVAVISGHMNDNTKPVFNYEVIKGNDIVEVGLHTGKIKTLKTGKAKIKVCLDCYLNKAFTLDVNVIDTTKATGAFSYSSVDYNEKAKILSSMEKYAVDNYLTGITMFSDGSQVCYNDRYKPEPQSYISGYGWGTYREGKLTGDCVKPGVGANPKYMQIATTALPAHANPMNASGSDVSSLSEKVSTTYFGSRMNETADGYEWYPLLSTDNRPIPYNDNGTPKTGDLSTLTNNRWRIHLRNDAVYKSASTDPLAKTYNNKKVELEDYITPLKFMLTCYNGQFRGAELTKGVSGFASGAARYYAATSAKGASSKIYDEEKWNQYMSDVIKTGTEDDGRWYIEFNLLQPCTQFYAMYYLNSNLFSPLPEAFIESVGADNLGKSPTGKSPVDTMLYTGPYYIESWTSEKLTLKKNELYFDGLIKDSNGQPAPITEGGVTHTHKETLKSGKERYIYSIEGIDEQKVENAAKIRELFLDGSVDSFGPNKDDLAGDFSNNNGTGKNESVKWTKYQTKGEANFKINVNATTKEQWLTRFGEKGDVKAHTKNLYQDQYYFASRKYMSNKDFLDFLSFGLDRKTLCEARGSKPTQDYFSDNYLINPEPGDGEISSYNETEAHKSVLADRYNDTYGYNEEAAKSSLKKCFKEIFVPMANAYELKGKGGQGAGTSSNPYLIPVTMSWMNPTDTDDYKDVFDSIKRIFKEVAHDVYHDSYALDLKQEAGTSNYQAVYDKMKGGEFDLGFGAITGSALDPINFMEVLKSDNSSSFTLNWGPDTSKIDESSRSTIVYDNRKWSYDALWNAANTGVLLDSNSDACNVKNISKTQGEDQYESKDDAAYSVTYKVSFKDLMDAGKDNGIRDINLNLTNSTHSLNLTLDDLNATADNNYEGSFTLDDKFNTSESYNQVEGKSETIDSPIISADLTFKVTMSDGSEKIFTATSKFLSWNGITGISRK